ncbi:SusC/RagA family TonB-linked outer membrane protein [Gelidibacter sp. F63206]|uniref:SusC/RagA family TonB-linked outer membrane protein n=1 Tax=Gelidibacter sp. F63206 TaxID=2926425 RepID=UPI001FF18FD9|nr:SusC/RagA family TonB-linked outer membrane protein [Gelidibacter sp. F63206]MCK0115094.1 SusC/RagA family TonB-linked outer membrane protein [Gelidibacter sp. F63206]
MTNNHKSVRWRRIFVCFLFFLSISMTLSSQDLLVSGKVTDGNLPISGANVIIKNTTNGVVTDFDGRYNITAKPTDTLQVSYLGYTTLTIPIQNRSTINVILKEDATALGEVQINAGYYTVKDKERTGSISRITAKDIENQPINNMLSAAQGRMAGVNITQNSGVPGGGYEIQIRGTNSLRREGNYPLYIINGVPINPDAGSSLSGATFPNNGDINPLNAINPNDIESIEILKDADATAIYGSRGANGIILVTTKKGHYANKTNISINTNYTMSHAASKIKLMNTQQYLEMRQQAFANDGIDEYPSTAYDINGTWDQNRYTDWQDKLIGRTATNSMVQLSINGGSKNSSFIVSGSHNEQTTVFGNDYTYKTNNLSGNFNYHSDDLKFTLGASGLFSNQSNNIIQTDITRQSLRLSPNSPALYNEDGSLNWEDNTFTNPIASYEQTYFYNSKTLNTNFNLGYEIVPFLSIKLNGGINYLAFDDMLLYPSSAYNPSFGLTSAISSVSKSKNQRFSYLLEPQLKYTHKFDNHKIDILIGGTYQESQNSVLSVFGYDFDSNALITNLAAAGTTSISSDAETTYKYAAAFGRINYQYKNRYILNLTGRRDGSSRFGPNKRFSNFQAIGAAWIFSEEKWARSQIPFLSYGKLRGSYGTTGNDAIGDYLYLDSYSIGNTHYGGNTVLIPSRLFNPDFSWEKTTKLEVAMELGFLENRLHLNASWYRNLSGEQLVGIPLPGTTGFNSIQANLPATVENKGVEFELHATPVNTDDVQWNSDFNISFPKNKLTAFPNIDGSTYANQYVVGYPTNIIKTYQYQGIDSETGLYTFKDYNGDGKITSPEDNQVIEEVGTKFFGGWSNRISRKNFQFSFLFQFVKQKLQNYNNLMPTPGSMYNQPVEVLNVWSENNPEGEYMPYSAGFDAQKSKLHGLFANSSGAIGDASYIRLKNIQLSYRLSTNHFLKDILIYVQGQNLFTLTNYFGLDPEFTQIGFLPPLKTYSLGAQFNF